jgi:hypothetical protein
MLYDDDDNPDNTFDDKKPTNQIGEYLKGRMLCSMEAMWRCLGYQLYPPSIPAVIVIKPKTPADLLQIQSEQKLCDLHMYLYRPSCLQSMTFTEWAKMFLYTADIEQLPKQYKEQVSSIINLRNSRDEYFSNSRSAALPIYDDLIETLRASHSDVSTETNFYINGLGLHNDGGQFLYEVYVYRRSKPDNMIVRLSKLYPNAGELYYIRELLAKFPVSHSLSNYLENKETGESYQSYQDAAISQNIITHATYAKEAFYAAIKFKASSRDLRILFATLTIHGHQTSAILKNPSYLEALTADLNQQDKEDSLIEELQPIFVAHNKDINDFAIFAQSIPELSEIELERNKYNITQQQLLYESLLSKMTLTEEMQDAFNRIDEALTNKTTLRILIQGVAGTGKSTFIKLLMAYVRSRNFLALGCASTAFAATVYPNCSFDTFHNLFNLPVQEDSSAPRTDVDLACRPTPARAALLTHTRVICADEIGSLHNKDFSAVYDANNRYITNSSNTILLTLFFYFNS